MTTITHTIERDSPKLIKAWTFYDWANSVFPLVITSAIFPNFYDAVTATKDASGEIISHQVTFFGYQFENQNIYSFVYSFALAIVVLITPILSGIADYLGKRKRFLQFFCYLGSFSCMSLFFFDNKHLELSMIPFVTATIGFWASLVYYNSYLPQIASPQNQDKVSSRGYSLGYLGSALLLIICLVGIMVFKMPAKYSFLLTGIWWVLFAQYTFRYLPNDDLNGIKIDTNKLLYRGFNELKIVYNKIKLNSNLIRFLYSYFFFNMGVQTIMVVAVIFARTEINWPNEGEKTSALIVSILIIQFVGILGAFLFSRLSKLIGNKYSLMVAIIIWIIVCVCTYAVVKTPFHFYIIAFWVGMVMGGIQALSRSTYSKYLPGTEDHTSYFSFYDIVEKLGMIIGTFSFGFISQVSGSMRNSILSLITFFIIGLILLFFVKDKKVQE